MSKLELISAQNACPAAGPYSHAVRTNGFAFISGQIPANSLGEIIERDIGQKTKACCDNIKAILDESGTDISRVVEVTVFLTDMCNFTAMNSVYETVFAHKLARSCVAVSQLPKGVRVEIECIAIA